jgi:hypothetical protein
VNTWSWYWLWWAILALGGGFLGPELWALFTGHPENTLSAQVWRIEGLTPGEPLDVTAWTFAHVALGGLFMLLFLWLIGHFVFGWWH